MLTGDLSTAAPPTSSASAHPLAAGRAWASVVPIAVLATLLAGAFFAIDPTAVIEPPWLVLLGNSVFISGVGLVVAVTASRNFRATGRAQVLLLGAAVLLFGLTASGAALVRTRPGGANLNVTVYNVGALLAAGLHFGAAFCLLAGVSPEVAPARRGRWVAVTYACVTMGAVVITVAAVRHGFPRFFVQGTGPTAVRQFVLGGAWLLFVVSLVVFLGTYVRTRDAFLLLYGCGLACTAISLSAFLIQHAVGSAVGWVGRCSQYVGGIYFLAALATAARAAHQRGTSLDAVLTSSLSGTDEKFRALAENAPDIIRRFDRDLRHVYVNAAGEELYGRPPRDVVGRTLLEAGLPGSNAAALAARIRRVFDAGERIEFEEYAARGDEAAFYHSECVPEYGPGGAVTNVLVVSRDLTAYQRAQEALRASEARFRSLFDTMTEGFAIHEIITDDRGEPVDYRFLEVNPAFERLTGLRRAELIGRTFRTVLPGEGERWIREYGRVALTGESVQFEQYATVLGRHYEVFAFRNAPRQFAVLFMDVTQRKQAEEVLAAAKAAADEANRQKDQFLAVLSHELRNPLAPIWNSVHVLEHAPPGSEAARRAQQVIRRQASHLSRLVDDLLDVTRIARNKIELRREDVDLREVVRRACDDFRTFLETRGVTFRAVLPASELWSHADAARITQVVGNLLHNAAKFTTPGDEVTVSLQAPGDRAELHVRDTGVGIEPALLQTIFDPFVQGERTLARTKGGLGLGLALVKGIVELHGGTVRASSGGPGLGAEFVVTLPVLARAGAAPAPAKVAPHGGRRVLVVDDNADAADSLAELVREYGHTVEVTYDGTTAVEHARANPPDVVLCDIGLPGMSGYDVARALRATHATGLRLFALSGYAQPDDVASALAAGFDGHLAKPCDPEVLERILAR